MPRTKDFKIEKKWIFLDKNKPKFDSEILSKEIIAILSNRGINSEKEALDFLDPKYESLTDPYLLIDMDKAVKLIIDAINDKEKITIYGDYDVDGVTATALLIRFFRLLELEVDYYIPSRHDEGYGLNSKAIEEIASWGTKLIITVDCGSTSINEIDRAKELGLKVLVTDHHSLKKEGKEDILPKADAIINPKRVDSIFSQELAGVGVAFYLIRALHKKLKDRLPEGAEKWLLDLVALGTICDVVPLIGDNRILSKFGLVVLSKTKSIGIKAIAEVAGLNLKEIDSYKVGFVIGPRLNAAGRIDLADKALKLLTTDDAQEANLLARELNNLNAQRQELTEKIINEAKDKIISNKANQKIYLLADKNWPSGIVGIVASRLADEFGRPILIMEETESEYKGSARSIAGFNIVDALSGASDFLIHFGGHAYAAGFRLKKEDFKLLEDRLVEIAEDKISESDLMPEVLVDKQVLNKNITQKLMKEVKKLAPFGNMNYSPIFALTNQEVLESRLVGNPRKHLKLTVKDDGGYLSGIAFNYGYDELKIGDKIDLAFALEENTWNGQTKIEARFIDIAPSK